MIRMKNIFSKSRWFVHDKLLWKCNGKKTKIKRTDDLGTDRRCEREHQLHDDKKILNN